MSPDGLQEQSRESGAPAASLTLVRVQRRRSALQPSRKAGDLTQRLMEEKALAPTQTPASPTPTPLTITPAAPAPSVPPPAPEPMLLAPPAEDTDAVIALPGPSESFAPASDDAAPAPITVAADREPIVSAEPEPTSFAPADEPEPPVPAFAPIAEPQPMPLAEPALEMPEVAAHDEVPERDAAPTGADALIDYWDERAGDRLFPALAELDRERIAEQWPNTVLLTFGNGDMPRMTRLGEPDGEVDYNLMVTDWILSRGRQAAERAEALEEEQRFPIGRGRVRYRLVLLPCSNEGSRVDHMLCHVSRLPELPKLGAVASFKRWLAS
ncbi:MAG TPA: hypothetical protein VGU20_24860 [Stellaceae bacterium]|nr:hypothetical protein [Stellaceae bacterium]